MRLERVVERRENLVAKPVQRDSVNDEGQQNGAVTLVRAPTRYAIASTEKRDQPQLEGQKSPTRIIKPSELTAIRSHRIHIPRIETYDG